MEKTYDALGIIDRPHLPTAGTGAPATYKEWFHFNVLDAHSSGLDLIINLSLAGNVRVSGAGRTDLILLAAQGEQSWRGNIDSYEATATSLRKESLDITLATNEIRFTNGSYRIDTRLRDGQMGLQLELVPTTQPMMIWNDTPLGSGHLNWLIVPHLRANGWVEVDGRCVRIDDACAYHDHNWGHWKWGEDFGWEWGFSSNACTQASRKYTIVFDRTINRSGSVVNEQTLAVWQGGKLAKLFTRHMLRARRDGIFRGRVPRLPGIMQMIAQGEVLTIPAEYRISARDGDDWVDVTYRVESGLQITVPTDFGFGYMELNETFGAVHVAGEIGGQALNFTERGCFEFMA